MVINTDPLFIDATLLQQAEKLCQQRLQNDSQNRTVLRSLGEVCRKQGKLPAAAAAYSRLFQLDAADQEAGYLASLFNDSVGQQPPAGFRAAPFVILRNFLPPDFHESLIPFLTSARDRFVPALMTDGKGGQSYNPTYRDTLDFTDEWTGRDRFWELFEKVLPPVTARLHIAPFAVQQVELHVRAYQDGHFFQVHTDSPPARPAVANRTVSFVYFFHRMPRAYTGGELLLFDTNTETNAYTRSRFTCLIPEDNALALFPSNYYHCVVPVICPSREFTDSRFVINGFIHRRPEGQPAIPASDTNTQGVAAP